MASLQPPEVIDDRAFATPAADLPGRAASGQRGGVIACHDCGSLHRLRALPRGSVALCATCGKEIDRGRRTSTEATLALTLAATVLYAVAHLTPFMSLVMEGRVQTATLFTGIVVLAEDGMWPLSVLVLLVASLIPGARLVAGLYVLSAALRGAPARHGALALRLRQRLAPWAMMEVFLLGCIVAYVKLADLAGIGLHAGAFAFVGVVLLMVVADSFEDRFGLWVAYGEQAQRAPAAAAAPLACHGCGQLVSPPALDDHRAHGADASPDPDMHGAAGSADHHAPDCPRCGAALHRRKPDALARTWALLVAATILYIPANLLPIMNVVFFGHGEPDTIMSGVIALLAAGQVPVAALVFFASITVPVLKLIGLTWLLVSVQFGWTGAARQRTHAYRLIEGIGRWSMVDIFMISILVALVNVGAIATIEPGPGALCFGAVVVLTMLASASFDPRLIWDVREARGARDAIQRA